MKKLVLALSLAVVSGTYALAQSSTGYNKGEFFAGYSNGQVDTGARSNSGNSIQNFFNDRANFNGFDVSGVYNISRHFGIKADFSGTYKQQSFSSTIAGTTVSGTDNFALYNALGGVQYKDNASKGRLKPFAYALGGLGHSRTNVTNVTCTPAASCPGTFTNQTLTDTGFAMAFGGGLDLRLNDRFDIRLIQADYNPIRFGGTTTQNARFGFGIVLK